MTDKQRQKELLIEIMDQDAKDGLYEDTVKLEELYKEAKQLAEESWEGCDGCDQNDKNFWMGGFFMGYITAKNK